MRDYVSVTYNPKDKPFTRYPRQLADYIVDRFRLKPGTILLDLGCGRGEYLDGFLRRSIDGYGVDKSNYYSAIYSKQCDLLKDPIPFRDNFFDVVFAKSLFEHFYFPEKIASEAYRVLKPGGLLITLTPECEGIEFFADFTHRAPFWPSTIRELLTLCEFDDVKVERFLQVSALWQFPSLKWLFRAIAAITPDFIANKVRWIKHSKGYMILGTGKKAT